MLVVEECCGYYRGVFFVGLYPACLPKGRGSLLHNHCTQYCTQVKQQRFVSDVLVSVGQHPTLLLSQHRVLRGGNPERWHCRASIAHLILPSNISSGVCSFARACISHCIAPRCLTQTPHAQDRAMGAAINFGKFVLTGIGISYAYSWIHQRHVRMHTAYVWCVHMTWCGLDTHLCVASFAQVTGHHAARARHAATHQGGEEKAARSCCRMTTCLETLTFDEWNEQ